MAALAAAVAGLLALPAASIAEDSASSDIVAWMSVEIAGMML